MNNKDYTSFGDMLNRIDVNKINIAKNVLSQYIIKRIDNIKMVKNLIGENINTDVIDAEIEKLILAESKIFKMTDEEFENYHMNKFIWDEIGKDCLEDVHLLINDINKIYIQKQLLCYMKLFLSPPHYTWHE